MVDCVGDLAAIADELGIDRFAVTGGSGGGPHALAVAARLPERVTRVACVVGGAPYDAEDLDWYAGMDPVNVREFGWAVAGEDTLAAELEREAQEWLTKVDDGPAAVLGDVDLSESDRAVLDDPGFQEVSLTPLARCLPRGIGAGWMTISPSSSLGGSTLGSFECRSRFAMAPRMCLYRLPMANGWRRTSQAPTW